MTGARREGVHPLDTPRNISLLVLAMVLWEEMVGCPNTNTSVSSCTCEHAKQKRCKHMIKLLYVTAAFPKQNFFGDVLVRLVYYSCVPSRTQCVIPASIL